jgi:hypothetical protein
MLRKRGKALAGVDGKLAVLLGELPFHAGLGAVQDRPHSVRDHDDDD